MTAIALTIAGSDSGGGAGIQADLKTFSALGVYGASVLTAITAQSTLGVSAVEDVSASMIDAQMKAVLSDLDVNAIKIGMLSREDTIRTVADGLQQYAGPVVLDPVMVATSGDRLLRDDAVAALKSLLMPRVTLITPNLFEAAILTGLPVAETHADVVWQAEQLRIEGAAAVLIKGGHGGGIDCVDVLLTDRNTFHEFRYPRLQTINDHGTGCTLSAAIAAQLAHGHDLLTSVAIAKDYLHEALAAGRFLAVGHGHGPVHHFFAQWPAPRDLSLQTDRVSMGSKEQAGTKAG
ncbi:bifunctional hydroxymethylpyrimidine kinase/phosphomethylpyrimidine kinase [Rhizobiales bacterium RZME27]|uniref:hydroxymethylpyrimidine kinase n=1 Tax=Endobacterium cereale TaxID=2663029 RepID=A0A6A8ABW2_9HYPH|nr:bifunctional hydroxymethylpyrimidine kinase/phosphomethylpyrimidine kinase [Endobacterium cereale]MEB2844250.1 bifunctional hydroxymethylpyrimidine kinase/phosphomethylpyrimidine kinase [Endobacterium cereale]MQY48662.1 bifunctional hydroxymethylpyrimidine kinase/phosphomethylpyrimidine kinase [Endobacterium cereale]